MFFIFLAFFLFGSISRQFMVFVTVMSTSPCPKLNLYFIIHSFVHSFIHSFCKYLLRAYSVGGSTPTEVVNKRQQNMSCLCLHRVYSRWKEKIKHVKRMHRKWLGAEAAFKNIEWGIHWSRHRGRGGASWGSDETAEK